MTEPAAERLHLGDFEVTVATELGPRILGLARSGGPNLFASVPDETLDWPGGRAYHFVGGHRLWCGPEVPAQTYVPDDDPVTIDEGEGCLAVTGSPEPDGVVKSIALTLDGDRIIADHTITNLGREDRHLAPWAITQFITGGTATLELTRAPGPQADRSIVLWPYTDVADPRWVAADDAIVVTSAGGPPLKVGTGGGGTLSYHIQGWVFSKSVDAAAGPHADLGATRQCFSGPAFLELETLGPLVNLSPGTTVQHRETWTLTEAAA